MTPHIHFTLQFYSLLLYVTEFYPNVYTGFTSCVSHLLYMSTLIPKVLVQFQFQLKKIVVEYKYKNIYGGLT